MGVRSKLAASLLALGLVMSSVSSVRADERFLGDAGTGVAAIFVNLGYVPAKVIYSLLGGVTGGFAYALTGGNYEIAESIWTPSMGGTYVVSPPMLRGDEPIYFSGVTEGPDGTSGGLEDDPLGNS